MNTYNNSNQLSLFRSYPDLTDYEVEQAIQLSQTMARARQPRIPETYPKTVRKLPARISGNGANHDVLAWVLAKNKPSNYPGGYVLAHNPDEVQPYVVWEVCTRDGGETWQVAGSGDYSFTHEDAMLRFMFRLSGRDIATEPLSEPEPEEAQRHPDAYDYGEPWGPDNPAPGSAWNKNPA